MSEVLPVARQIGMLDPSTPGALMKLRVLVCAVVLGACSAEFTTKGGLTGTWGDAMGGVVVASPGSMVVNLACGFQVRVGHRVLLDESLGFAVEDTLHELSSARDTMPGNGFALLHVPVRLTGRLMGDKLTVSMAIHDVGTMEPRVVFDGHRGETPADIVCRS